MTKSKTAALVPLERITNSILILRGHRVLLDADLAALYEVDGFEVTTCDLKGRPWRPAL